LVGKADMMSECFFQGNPTLQGNPHDMVIYFLSCKYILIMVNTETVEPEAVKNLLDVA